MAIGPLDGVMVLDFTIAAVGPICSRILADMGADVIRIEWPRALPGRRGAEDSLLGRFSPEGIKSGANILFIHCNGGKKSVCVNLKEERGVQMVQGLVKHADVLVENFTPHAMRNFGLDYPNVRKINPSIVMCSLTGYGQEGIPGYPDHPCTDPVGRAMGGLDWVTGPRNGPPYEIGSGLGDTVSSMAGAIAVLGALYHKRQTGQGQYIDTAMIQANLFLDCTTMPYVAANNGGNMFFRNGQQNTYTCPMGVFKAKEGYVALQAPGQGRESGWGRLCIAAGREDLIDNPHLRSDRDRIEHTEEMLAAIEGWMQTLPDDEAVLAVLAEARISSGPVLSQEQILTHPIFLARGAVKAVEYPEVGPVKVVQPPYILSETPAYVRGPAPQYGEHNHEVLKKYLGMSEEEVKKLTDEGVLHESEAARRRRGVSVGTA